MYSIACQAPLSIEFSRQNTGMGSCSLLQGIFPTQGSNSGLPHCRQILYHLSDEGSWRILEWVANPFSRGTSRPRDRTRVSCFAGRLYTSWATREWDPTILRKVGGLCTWESLIWLPISQALLSLSKMYDSVSLVTHVDLSVFHYVLTLWMYHFSLRFSSACKKNIEDHSQKAPNSQPCSFWKVEIQRKFFQPNIHSEKTS